MSTSRFSASQGTEFYMALVGMLLGIIVSAMLYVPLLFPLKLTSVFEVRSAGSRVISERRWTRGSQCDSQSPLTIAVLNAICTEGKVKGICTR